MKILVTAGSTQVPIDRVRCISNIFKGRTGVSIAKEAACYRGMNTPERYNHQGYHSVTLLANPGVPHSDQMFCKYRTYKTFDELHALMEEEITTGNYDAIIHSAAVSDFKVKEVFDGKIKSSEELTLHLVPTIKLIDQIREPWGFKGKLVKFKLQVGITKEELLAIAVKSRLDSKADFIVANLLDDFKDWETPNMYIVSGDKSMMPGSSHSIEAVSRSNLAKRIIDLLEGIS